MGSDIKYAKNNNVHISLSYKNKKGEIDIKSEYGFGIEILEGDHPLYSPNKHVTRAMIEAATYCQDIYVHVTLFNRGTTVDVMRGDLWDILPKETINTAPQKFFDTIKESAKQKVKDFGWTN